MVWPYSITMMICCKIWTFIIRIRLLPQDEQSSHVSFDTGNANKMQLLITWWFKPIPLRDISTSCRTTVLFFLSFKILSGKRSQPQPPFQILTRNYKRDWERSQVLVSSSLHFKGEVHTEGRGGRRWLYVFLFSCWGWHISPLTLHLLTFCSSSLSSL